MRRDPALRAWLADPAAGAHGAAAASRAARAARDLPALARFRERLAAVAPDDGDAVDGAAAALLADPGWCATLVEGLVRELVADPFFVPPQPAIDNGLHHGLVLHDCARASVAIGVGSVETLAARKEAGGGALIFSGYRARLRFLRAGGVTVAFHALDAGGRARRVGRRRLADGDGFAIDGAHATWVAEHARADMLILQVSIRAGRAPLLVEHDPGSGLETARSTNDEGASRTQMLVSLLGAMNRGDAVPAIAAATHDPQPFVRWHAARQLAALDPQAALLPLTRLAATDPAADVRGAARATLRLLEAAAPCRG